VLFPAEKLSYCRFQGYTVHYSLLVIHLKKQNAFHSLRITAFFAFKEEESGKKAAFSMTKTDIL
jgi:hypothetical protein